MLAMILLVGTEGARIRMLWCGSNQRTARSQPVAHSDRYRLEELPPHSAYSGPLLSERDPLRYSRHVDPRGYSTVLSPEWGKRNIGSPYVAMKTGFLVPSAMFLWARGPDLDVEPDMVPNRPLNLTPNTFIDLNSLTRWSNHPLLEVPMISPDIQ